MKAKQGLISLLLGTLLVVAMLGCAQPAPPPVPAPPAPAPTPAPTPAPPVHEQVTVTMLTSRMGAGSYVFGNAFADIVNKNHPWIRMSVLAGYSSNAGVVEMDARDHKTTIVTSAMAAYWDSVLGNPPFEKKYNTKLVSGGLPVYALWATTDPEIRTVKDFVGKSVAVPPLSQAMGMFDKHFIDYYVSLDKLRLVELKNPQAAAALKDGLIDVALFSLYPSTEGWRPHTDSEELWVTRGKDLFFIPFYHEGMDAASKIMGVSYPKSVVPAGALDPNHPAEPIEAFTVMIGNMVALDDFDDEIAYELTKLLVEKLDVLHTYHMLMGGITRDRIVAAMPVLDSAHPDREIHAGALKYYKEVGLIK